MEIRQLKYFLQVCQDRSFSKAANHLYITQQALSQSIKNMEDEFSVALFTRSNQGIVLTDAAITIYEKVARFVDEFDNLNEEIQKAAKAQKGTLRIALPPGSAQVVLPELLGNFKRRYPDITLKISEYRDLMCEEKVKTGQADAGCSISPIDPELFDAVPIIREKTYVCVHKSNPLAQREYLTFKDLKDQRFLLISNEFKRHYTIIQRCREAGFEPTISHLSSHAGVLLGLVEENLGITLLEARLVNQPPDSEVALVPIDPAEEFLYEVNFITGKKRPLKYPAAILLQYIRELYDGAVYPSGVCT